MTFTEEFEDRELEEFEEYPVAFGITFTPRNSGIAAAVVGLLGSFYLLFNWVMPAYDTLQQLQNDAAGKQQQIDQQKSGLGPAELAKIESQLQQKEATKQQILALFAQEKNLSTILLDISNIFKSRNVKLISFQPQGLEPVVVSDGSLGSAVNNKLKRQTLNVKIEGNYANTQEVIRDLERLQPLILLNSLNTQMEKEGSAVQVVSTGKNKATIVPQGDKPVTTTFLLDVIIPLNAAELAKLAPPPPAEGQPPASPPQ
ncbi:MAG: pilus assembly protein [Microcystis aeruginosa K13-05]|uniref:pilus assembly protein n=1 Tax=Microcystis TaxID=1125 RepID=UPI0009346B9B|nr:MULTISPECIES: pilus assembly protein [Microcystis]MCZ8049199.1 pilus assembly protein [Microcystis sp. LE19-41.2A]MCZ8290367.1 pilus assembly protein [Microcystis sp. LE19-59.1C]NCR80310.1 pilus assembly protein [Microcystis aeruginosa K13-10]NCR84936.1 pilus assembly protein [Microcystis aeruginosa K13-05]